MPTTLRLTVRPERVTAVCLSGIAPACARDLRRREGPPGLGSSAGLRVFLVFEGRGAVDALLRLGPGVSCNSEEGSSPTTFEKISTFLNEGYTHTVMLDINSEGDGDRSERNSFEELASNSD